MKQVGRELGVSYVLEGGVRKAGERVRFTAQLVETETDARVWADRFDGVIANIFDLQDEITASVVGAIVVGSSSVDLEDSGFDRGWKKPTAA